MMDEISQIYMVCSGILVLVGLYSIMSSRNMIRTVIAVEIITVGVNLNFIALGSAQGVSDSLAQSIVLTSTVIGAAIAAVALSMVIYAYKHYGSIDLKKLRRLRW